MNEKQKQLLKNVLAGVVADDSPIFTADADFDVDSTSAAITSKLNTMYSGKVHGDISNKLVNALVDAGLVNAETTNITELKKSKIPDLVASISQLASKTVDERFSQKLTESQKTVAEQTEAIKKAITDSFTAKENDYKEKISSFERKEYDNNLSKQLRSSMPAGFTPTDAQEKAVKMLLLDKMDVRFDSENNGVSIFYKGTETPFGLKSEKPTIMNFSEVVASTLKELGLWTEKPIVQKTGFKPIDDKNDKKDTQLTGVEARVKAAKAIFNGSV